MTLRPDPFFTYLPEAVALADTSRTLTWVNEAFCTLFGYDADDIVGKCTSVLYANPADFRLQGDHRFSTDASPDPAPYRVQYAHADGTGFLAETTGGPVCDEAGQVAGFIAFLRAVEGEGVTVELLRKIVAITSDDSRPLAQRLQSLLRLGSHHFGLPIGLISKIDTTSDTLHMLHVVDPGDRVQAGTERPLQGTYCARTIRVPGAVSFHHASSVQEEAHPCLEHRPLEAYIGCAIRIDGEVFGAISFARAQPSRPFTRDDHMVIELMASWVGNALMLDRRQRELEHLAHTDALTGLWNRRHQLQQLDRAIEVARDDREPLTVLWADLDHFKSINDLHGHLVGDRALRHFAEVTTALVRGTDQVGRVGGEEFLFVLPGATERSALAIVRRLLDGLAASPLMAGSSQVSVSASFGIAQLRPLEDASSLIRRADEAMYAAKRAGRARAGVAD